MLSIQPVHVWGMDAHSDEEWLITSGKGHVMPMIDEKQIELYRKIEVLEAALTVTLAAVSTALPSVKTDVIKNLRMWAEHNKGNDVAPKAFTDLADKIESTKFGING